MCYHPVEIKVQRSPFSRDGKYILVKCRQCLSCRQERSKEWALRCMTESERHKEHCFITLTYEKSPVHLVKKDLQDFIKRLRKHIAPKKIRYFACGEYGSQKRRPHYHVLIFGYDFPDKYKESESDKGYAIYNSETLEKIWGRGLVTVQDMTINSAGYCALYSSEPRKKLPVHLRDYPEFNTMSQGLGTDLLLKDLDKYMETDEIWYDGRKYRIPQTVLNKRYNKVAKMIDKGYLQLKAERVMRALLTDNSILSKIGGMSDKVEQEKYRKENALKRLTKKL